MYPTEHQLHETLEITHGVGLSFDYLTGADILDGYFRVLGAAVPEGSVMVAPRMHVCFHTRIASRSRI